VKDTELLFQTENKRNPSNITTLLRGFAIYASMPFNLTKGSDLRIMANLVDTGLVLLHYIPFDENIVECLRPLLNVALELISRHVRMQNFEKEHMDTCTISHSLQATQGAN